MRRGTLPLVLALSAACTSVPSGPSVVLSTASGTTTVRVEIADTDALRQQGLMGRTELADDAGMLFLWADDTMSTFWMKDTLIPLSIAFVAADGRVLALLDMEPCRADPCPAYDPQLSYRMALEAKRGSFARWGVRVGDSARLVR
jgi:hypothetical protein